MYNLKYKNNIKNNHTIRVEKYKFKNYNIYMLYGNETKYRSKGRGEA